MAGKGECCHREHATCVIILVVYSRVWHQSSVEERALLYIRPEVSDFPRISEFAAGFDKLLFLHSSHVMSLVPASTKGMWWTVPLEKQCAIHVRTLSHCQG